MYDLRPRAASERVGRSGVSGTISASAPVGRSARSEGRIEVAKGRSVGRIRPSKSSFREGRTQSEGLCGRGRSVGSGGYLNPTNRLLQSNLQHQQWWNDGGTQGNVQQHKAGLDTPPRAKGEELKERKAGYFRRNQP